MKDDFTKNISMTVVLILGLLVLDRLPHFTWHSHIAQLPGIMIGEMHRGRFNREDFDALAAGYYEGLRKDAGPLGMPMEREDVLFRDDFLRYELKPNVKRSYPAGMRITNSLGMANPEYAYEKPPHTRRIALFGDSLSLGPYGHDYAALLEDRLNRDCLTPEIRRFQILNFAVYGYNVLQMMDVALEKAPKFHPDVYVVAMSELELVRRGGWRAHVARLMVGGTDLKYDYLRHLLAQAGVRPTDHLWVIEDKLAPFFLSGVRWILEQIRDHAASQGAQMIVILVPTAVDPQFMAEEFNRLRPATDVIGVPVMDLRDTFPPGNLEHLRVVRLDIHPNGRGHELIFENLYAKLRAQPEAWAALVGNATASADQAKASSRGKGR